MRAPAPGLFILLLLLGAVSPASASKSIRPEAFRKHVTLEVEGSTRSYWTLDSGQPLELTVRGPGTVKLITRLALGAADKGDYAISVQEADTEVSRTDLQTVVASGVRGAGERWGCHRDVTFAVPAGEHRYRVTASGPWTVLAVRPRFVAPKKRVRRVSLTPTRYDRALVLVLNEKEVTYYHVCGDAPLEVTVTGPTELQVNSRLDFAHTMNGGSNSYAIEVNEGETTLARAHFEVQRSQVAVWRDLPEETPGIVKGLRVPLTAGPHRLEIRLADTVAHCAGVKLYIPEDDVDVAASD